MLRDDPLEQLGPIPSAPINSDDLLAESIKIEKNDNLMQNQEIHFAPILDDRVQMENQPLIQPPPQTHYSPRFDFFGCFKSFCVAFCFVCFLLFLIYPIYSIGYTLSWLFKDSDHYTGQQYALILMMSTKVLLDIFFISCGQKFKSSLNFINFMSVVSHFIVWDYAHKNSFFFVPTANIDFVYRVNYFVFYTFLIFYLIAIGIIILIIMAILIFLLVEKYRKRKIADQNKSVLTLLKKNKRKEWESKQQLSTGVDINPVLDNCCICYCAIGDESFLTELPICRHIFHYGCVMEWLEKNAVCPYCRGDVIQNIQSTTNNI